MSIIDKKCNCDPNFDLRCCCWFNDDTFDTCKQKISSTYAYIMNTYELHKKVENYGIGSVEIYIRDVCRLSENEWDQIINLYNIDNVDSDIEEKITIKKRKIIKKNRG
jgi:hypothetical protein